MADPIPDNPFTVGDPPPPPSTNGDTVAQAAALIRLARVAAPWAKKLAIPLGSLATMLYQGHQANVTFRAEVDRRVAVLEASRLASDKLADDRWETTREQLMRIQEGLYRLSSVTGEEIPGIVRVARLARPSATPSMDTASAASPASPVP